MPHTRSETDSLGAVDVPSDRLWGAQTQRALSNFHIGDEHLPSDMVQAYALVKRAAAKVNGAAARLNATEAEAITAVCDELLAGEHADQFPLPVWISGSGTQFNMNVNEVIANRASQLAGQALGSKRPVHPNDHVNMAQSTNDNFPTAMHVAAARSVHASLLPALEALAAAIEAKAAAWMSIVKIGRTHLQDATPLTLGQEWSGYGAMLRADIQRIQDCLPAVYELAIGGTAVGTGVNAPIDFGDAMATELAHATDLPFTSAANKFAAQGAHDALVQLSATLRTLAVSLYKIANDIRFVACGPRSGIGELILPANEPGSSIMPGKINPTQCEAMTMVAVQVMGNDAAVAFGAAGGALEMNMYKPLIIFNLLQSIRLLSDACVSFRVHMIEGTQPNEKKIAEHVENSLMLVTSLAPAIGYERAAEIAHHAHEHGTSLREAALALKAVSAEEFDRMVVPADMTHPGAR